VRLANREKNLIINKRREFGKEEIKWQKKESQRPMFQHVRVIRARRSAAAIAGTK
jgi:hypothetical protein